MFRIRLRELREAFGYKSQQAFANAFGVAQSTVGGWEAGKREPNYETTIHLARFFDCSTDYLLGFSAFPHAALSGLSNSEMSKGLVSAFKCSKLSVSDVHSACEKHNIILPIEKLRTYLDGTAYPPSTLFVILCEILGVSDYYKDFGLVPTDLQGSRASIPQHRQISNIAESLYPDFENSDSAQELLSLCLQLNLDGQSKVKAYTRDLIDSGKYEISAPKKSGAKDA